MSPGFEQLFIGLLGLEFGSFANVCIYRWPRDSSIFHPRRSHCPKCRALIQWFDNLPILSYFMLRGRCRHCRARISWRYPVVEGLLAALWVAVYRLAPRPQGPGWVFESLLFFFCFVLVVTTFTDLDLQIIPDETTLSLLVAALLASPWNPFFSDGALRHLSQSLLGAIVGSGILWLVGFLGEWFWKREAMGGGDVKLLAAYGAVLGWKGSLLVILLGSMAGGIFGVLGLVVGRLKRKQYLPFGPFLNLGGILALAALMKAPRVLELVFG